MREKDKREVRNIIAGETVCGGHIEKAIKAALHNAFRPPIKIKTPFFDGAPKAPEEMKVSAVALVEFTHVFDADKRGMLYQRPDRG